MSSQHTPTRQARSRLLRGLAALLTFNVLLAAAAGWLVFVRGFDASASEPVSLMAFEPAERVTPISPIQVKRDTQTAATVSPTAALVESIEPVVETIVESAESEAAELVVEEIVDESIIEEHDGPTFNGRPIRPVKTIRMLVTAYSPDEKSCGKWADGITASGYSVWTNGMKLVAADTSILPFGSIITVPGYDAGKPVPVLDRGGKIKGNRLDVLYPTHEIARQWGAQRLDVVVWEYAD